MGQKDISEMDPADLPGVIAFQDVFTREFMASLEEVEDGYYLFESKTGGYTMMYPENAKMDQGYFEMIENHYEAVSFGENKETNDYLYFVRATYEEGGSTNESESLLRLLSTHSGYEGEYESIEYDDKTVYYAESESVDESGENDGHIFLAAIISNDSDQAVSIRFNLISDSDHDNNFDSHEIQKEVMNIIESIEFISDD